MIYKSILGVISISLLLMSSIAVNAATITINASNSGNYSSLGSTNGAPGKTDPYDIGYYTGRGTLNSWLGFDLSSVDSTITSAILKVWSPDFTNSSIITTGQTITWSGVSTEYSALGGGANALSIFDDLEDGPVFASGIHVINTLNEYTLNTVGVASLNSATSFWAIGGHNDSAASPANNLAFSGTSGAGTDTIQLVLEVSAVPIPAAAWLFGSGIIGLIAVARRKV